MHEEFTTNPEAVTSHRNYHCPSGSGYWAPYVGPFPSSVYMQLSIWRNPLKLKDTRSAYAQNPLGFLLPL